MQDLLKKTTELLEEEKSRPYAKYYTWEHGPLDEAAQKAYEKDVVFTPEQATSISQINDLLKPGYLPMELGVCTFPDGSALFANHIMMPDVTPEMFAWFMNWFPWEDVRYKIWVPGFHYGTYLSDETKKLFSDQSRTYACKVRGTSRSIFEDMGGGLAELSMTFPLPAELGFDMAIYPKEPEEGFICLVRGTNQTTKTDIILCHQMRPLPTGGSELRSRFWVGYGLKNSAPALTLPPGVKVDRAVVRYMWNHNILEYSRLRDLLPLLYKEFGDKPLGYGME